MASRASQSHPPLSQELDARFSVFLNPIRDLTKNWEVDIAKYLEVYLEELAGVTLSLDGGVTSMNFAEAAMLIQGSVAVYSKKVDFLWQMVQETLDLLSSRRALEEGVEGLEVGGSRGRKSRSDITLPFICMDNIPTARNIDLREDDFDMDSCRKSFRFLPSIPLNLVEKEVEKSQNRIYLRLKNNEVIGAKDDYRLNRCYLAPTGMLHLEVPGQMLLEGGTSSSVQAEEIVHHRNIPPDDEENEGSISPGQDADEIQHQDENSLHTPEDPPHLPEDPPLPAEDPPPLTEDPPTPAENLPLAEEITPITNEPPPPNNDLLPQETDHPKQRYGLRKRNKDDKEILATLKLTDKLKPIDPNADGIPERPPRAGRLRIPTPCPCHHPSENKKQKKRNMAQKSRLSVEEFITEKLKDMVNKKQKKGRSKVPFDILEEVVQEESRRIDAMKQKVAEQMRQDRLCAEEMKQATEEAGQRVRLSSQDEDDDDDPFNDDAPENVDLDSPRFVMPETHPMKLLPEPNNIRLNDSIASEEPASEYETLVQKLVADYVNSAQESIKSSELQRRVNEWRKVIIPKLQTEENRMVFDIHNYGSMVLDHFPSDGRKQTISFRELVADIEDPREISRHFLSCLMLANTHNIELSESEPGDLAMDCLEITLKSRVRHHEELEQYAAPSQAFDANVVQVGCRGSPGVCADITQTTNMQHEVNIITKKNNKKKRVEPR